MWGAPQPLVAGKKVEREVSRDYTPIYIRRAGTDCEVNRDWVKRNRDDPDAADEKHGERRNRFGMQRIGEGSYAT